MARSLFFFLPYQIKGEDDGLLLETKIPEKSLSLAETDKNNSFR
jgi:hypothetical protein